MDYFFTLLFERWIGGLLIGFIFGIFAGLTIDIEKD